MKSEAGILCHFRFFVLCFFCAFSGALNGEVRDDFHTSASSYRNWSIVVTQPGTVIENIKLNLGFQSDGQWLCLYDHCGSNKGGIYYGGGILVLADNVTIRNVTVDQGIIGIAAKNVKGLKLENNHLYSQSAWGIYLNGVNQSMIHKNVTDNAVRSCPESPDGCESAGILVLDSHENRFTENSCYGSGDCYYLNGEGLPSHNNYWRNNTCYNSPHNCWEITFSRGNRLEYNKAISVNGQSCFYPFWVGGSEVWFKQNEFSCIKSNSRSEDDARSSTTVPTIIHWEKP